MLSIMIISFNAKQHRRPNLHLCCSLKRPSSPLTFQLRLTDDLDHLPERGALAIHQQPVAEQL
jgi:hypothetical protein